MGYISEILRSGKDIIYRRWKMIIILSFFAFMIFILIASLLEKQEAEASKKASLKELNVNNIYMETLEKIETAEPKIKNQEK